MRRVGWCISILSIFKVCTPVLVCHQVPQKISFEGSACPPEALGRCGRVLGRGKISARYKGKNLRHQKTPPRNIGGVLACWLGVCLGGRGLFCLFWAGFVSSLSRVYGFRVGGYSGIVGFIHCGFSPSIICLSASSSLTRIEYLSSLSLLAWANFPNRVRSIPDWVASSLMLTSLNTRKAFRLLGFGLIMFLLCLLIV